MSKYFEFCRIYVIIKWIKYMTLYVLNAHHFSVLFDIVMHVMMRHKIILILLTYCKYFISKIIDCIIYLTWSSTSQIARRSNKKKIKEMLKMRFFHLSNVQCTTHRTGILKWYKKLHLNESLTVELSMWVLAAIR